MFEDPGDPKVRTEVVGFLNALAGAKGERTALADLGQQLAAAHPEQTSFGKTLSLPAQAIARDAGKDLGILLGGLADDSLASDWAFVCRQMAKDLAFGAPAALAKLEQLRGQIVRAKRARIVETAATATQQAIAPQVKALVDAIPPITAHGKSEKAIAVQPKNGIHDRLVARFPDATRQPVLFVGLHAVSTASGVFLNLAPFMNYADNSDDAVLNFLASNLYTGHGGHSILMKTWAAGLAYSNGLHPSVANGVVDYYAERCPLLPQTLRFVIDALKREKPDANIARYAIASAFDSRVADAYDRSAAAMAADFVDGQPPDVVRAFRTRVLAQVGNVDLTQELFARMPSVYGKVLPGYTKPDPTAIYFVIGNEKQLAAYQDYLHTAVGKTTTLFALYPRDFWLL